MKQKHNMPDAENRKIIERIYVNARGGQIHARRLPARDTETGPPLVCLHPAPYSGIYFTTVMPFLNGTRTVLAPDYPGYGGSAVRGDWPRIDDYADAMLEFAEKLELPQFDILGFHTGGLIGAEMSLRATAQVRRLLIIDIPFLDADARKRKFESEAKPRRFSPELNSLADEWTFNITKRLDSISFDRAFELLTESLRAADRANWAFGAAYSYACNVRLSSLCPAATIIATRSALLEPTRAAAAAIPGAHFVERLDIVPPVFEKNADRIAEEIIAAWWAR